MLGAAAITALWLLLPRSDGPVSHSVAQAQEQPDANRTQGTISEPIEADADGGTLRVCNQTTNPVSIAMGYRAERGWQSEGWWVAGPSECKTVYSGDVAARRYYYIYAADDIGGGSWDGNVFMCTRDESFTIFGVEDCLARGYERTGFFEIDTQNRSSWMLQLTDTQIVGAEQLDDSGADAPMDGAFGEDGGDLPDDTEAEGSGD